MNDSKLGRIYSASNMSNNFIVQYSFIYDYWAVSTAGMVCPGKKRESQY